jgi:hypothetical protein
MYMSYKQFFSTDSMMSYDEYLKFKSGNEEIKKRLSDKNDYAKSFIDYRSFLTLTMAYYKQINDKNKVSAPVSLASANSSYKSYKLFQDHVQSCNYCGKCTNISHIFYCKGIQNILYPYGNAILKQDNLHNMRYPSTLQLKKYCCNKCNRESCCCENPCPPPGPPCPLPCIPQCPPQCPPLLCPPQCPPPCYRPSCCSPQCPPRYPSQCHTPCNTPRPPCNTENNCNCKKKDKKCNCKHK